MNSPILLSDASDEPSPWEAALIRLFEDSTSVVTKEEAQQIAAQITDPNDGVQIAHAARNLAQKMCHSARGEVRNAGVLLLKELGKAHDVYAILTHAWLCWNDGPLKNHQYALVLVDDAISQPWPEWPVYERARIALGEAFRLRGLLLLRGEKIKRNPSEALRSFKFAADKYLDGEAAWYAAQMHSRDAAKELAHKAKPHAKAFDWYMDRAKKQGFKPAQPTAVKEAQS